MDKIIQVRKVPERVHRTLSVRAVAEGKSLSDYVLEELVRIAERPTISEVLERAAALGSGTTTEAIVAAVRAVREERDA